jgi:hypothetical protein
MVPCGTFNFKNWLLLTGNQEMNLLQNCTKFNPSIC